MDSPDGYHKPDHSVLAEYLAAYNTQPLAPATPPQSSILSRGPTAQAPARRVVLPSIQSGGVGAEIYTYKRPVAFVFRNERRVTTTFKDILLGLCDLLVRLHPNDFHKVTSLRGRKRAYFSTDFQGMTMPVLIDGTSIYAETNLSANNIIVRCQEMLAVLGHSRDELKIEVEDR